MAATGSNSPLSSSCHKSASLNSSIMEVKCFHEIPTTLQVCKKHPRIGKKLYGCPMWKTGNCGFFLWVDDMKSDIATEEMKKVRGEINRLEAKLEKMKMKKKEMKEELSTVKKEKMQMDFLAKS